MVLADKIVYLSNEYRLQVKNKLNWLFQSKRSLVIPNGIDLGIFHPAPKKNNTAFILGMQSRLIDIKDHITLLKAFALLSKKQFSQPLQLYLAGDGAYKDKLVNLTQQLGITDNTVFTGMIDEKNLVDFLNSLDIYIHASLGETMSTAIMQAMACGKTIIASDVAGINNMVQNSSNGLLVPVKNETAMAAVLEKLIHNPAERERLAETALQFAKDNFSNLTMFEQYKQAFLH
jgi:L-malate glycosyltransferase